jgi:hypothetical protein
VFSRKSTHAPWLLLALEVLAVMGCTGDEEPPTIVEPPPAPSKFRDPYEHTPSRFGIVPLHAGFSPDPRVVAGEALGQIPARSLHRRCKGWISETPDYLLEADTAFFQLYVLVRSASDSLLVVRKPDGSVHCNNNRQGTKDPTIRTNFPIGTSQVWVGVKDEGGSATYRLGFSEVEWRPSSMPLPDPR